METHKKDPFFDKMATLGIALTFEDVRLKTGYSETDPRLADTGTRFSRRIGLKIPLVSAAMDTVTTSPMAIAMAELGGLGIIHKALEIDAQAAEVRRVKLHLNCLIEKPISAREDSTIGDILALRDKQNWTFHSFPVLDIEGKLLGLLSRNDFDLCRETPSKLVRHAMTPYKELVTAPPGIQPAEARRMLEEKRKKVLPLINDNNVLTGMYVISDLMRVTSRRANQYNVDSRGHLLVGAAIGTENEELERADTLIKVGCDVIVIDTAHGDSKPVYTILKHLKEKYPGIDFVVGNVSEPESALRLAEAGADGIKVGQGPGAICTTRIVAGVGCPQVTAIYNCAKAVRYTGIPLCADGGIRYSGDIPIALGAGAHSVMLGRRMAGTMEAPGDIIETKQGRYKVYRGMGSLAAMKASKAARARYRQGDTPIQKLVPEGVESKVPYEGTATEVTEKLLGGLRAGMGYVGAPSIDRLRIEADFHRMSPAGLAESHPHDVIVTNEYV